MSEFVNDQACNPAGRKLIESFEQFAMRPYPDSGGVWTIAFGHTLGVTRDTPPVTLQQADQMLSDDLELVEHYLNDKIRYDLSSNQFSALCSLAYNIGVGNFGRSSLLVTLNGGDLDDVPAHIQMWTHDRHGNLLNGLVRRRTAEIALWNTPDPEPQESPDAAEIA